MNVGGENTAIIIDDQYIAGVGENVVNMYCSYVSIHDHNLAVLLN